MQNRALASGTRTQKTTRKASLGKKEKKRLFQLLLCLGLFFVVFLGKGVAPEAMMESGETLLEMIRTDTDFKKTASAFKMALTHEGTILEKLKNLSLNQKDISQPEVSAPAYLENKSFASAARNSLRDVPDQGLILTRLGFLQSGEQNIELSPDLPQQENGTEDDQAKNDSSGEEEIVVQEYNGPKLPAGATMEYYDLGLSETVSPVMGVLTSQYGYRDHPIDGKYSFHAGVDLAAEMGTEIAAFANGVVDFIGESESYGLYIQLDHGNGVKSFYCHCSKLCAQKGESVKVGQTIALVGETGNATGPHLHLEMEKDGMQLNPIYYIAVES